MPNLPPLHEARNKLLFALGRCFDRKNEPRMPWSVWSLRQYSPPCVPQTAHEIVSEYEAALMAEWEAKLESATTQSLKRSDLGSPAAKPKKPKSTKPRDDKLLRIRNVIQARHHVLSVLNSPGAAPRTRFNAIFAWVQATDDAGMADFFPNEFRALLAYVGQKLAKEKL